MTESKKYGGCILGGLIAGSIIMFLIMSQRKPATVTKYERVQVTVVQEKEVVKDKIVYVDKIVVQTVTVEKVQNVQQASKKKTTEYREDGTVLRVNEEEFSLGLSDTIKTTSTSSETTTAIEQDKTSITEKQYTNYTSTSSLEIKHKPPYRIGLGISRSFNTILSKPSYQDLYVYGGVRLGDSPFSIDGFVTGRKVLGLHLAIEF